MPQGVRVRVPPLAPHLQAREGQLHTHPMKTQVEKLPQSRIALEIEVEPERVEQALDRAYRKLVKQIHIPGFRRGKAPRAIVEMRIGRDALMQEALDVLVPEVYREAVQQEALSPVGDPEFDLIEAEAGRPLRLKVEVDVRPEVVLGDYRGLQAEKVVERITDVDVQEVLQTYQERHSQLITADREVLAEGDFAVIDFEGYVDGQPFQGGAAKGLTIEIGSDQLVPGFEEQLVGMQRGETRDVTVTFPEDGYREDLRGKEAVFRVTLQEIKEKHVPAIDDELAKEASEYETLDEWKAAIREKLEEGAEQEARDRLRDELARKAVDNAVVELPATLVEREIARMLADVETSIVRDGGSLPDFLRETGQTLGELREQLRPRAEARVRMSLVIDAIATAEGIDVTEEEIDAEMERLIGGLGGEALPPEAVERMKNNPEGRERMRDLLRVRKAVDRLESTANVEVRWVDSLAEELSAKEPTAEEPTPGDEESAEGANETAQSDEETELPRS